MIKLSSVLLFALTIPILMTYRISPGETPYFLFGIIFAFLLGYLGIDLVEFKKKEFFKNLLFWTVMILVVGSVYLSAIIVRHQTAPGYQIHDIILQQESAIRFFLQGINPWATDYFGTPLEGWQFSDTQLNPALYHFVMMPGYLLFSLPFRLISVPLFGFFDGRMPLLALFGLLLFLAWRLVKDPENRRLLVILLAFNPATFGYFLEGRSDIFMFAFLFWGWYWLGKKRYALAGIPMAIAFSIKQSVWPIFPLYIVFLWLKSKKDLVKTFRLVLPFGVVFGLIVLPFAIWNGPALWKSTVTYLSGATEHSYPIAGYGWGMVLYRLGQIKELGSFYPFWRWQLGVGLPLMGLLLIWLAKRPSVFRLIVSYGLFTFIFWYFSRYFNNSHLGYLSMVFITAYFWEKKENLKL